MERFRGVEGHVFGEGFDLRLQESKLELPGRWRRPRKIFVNSMSDLFHKDIPRWYLDRVFDVMEEVDRHVYQVLTKRSSLMRDYVRDRYGDAGAPGHVWLGVSVEDRAALVRLRHLRETPAVVRFVSMEPLLEGLGEVDLTGVSWVIAGGESGPGARPVEEGWLVDIRDRCAGAGVDFFFKQWGGVHKKETGRLLQGEEYLSIPGVRNAGSVPELAGAGV